ncbi:hypothetical protein [Actinoplanes regularis]|uniref:Uncharacterized protein n=1 Tax=Actinoplanes regularis TaxID=52697 RepID=A0A239FET5_9ACTN|nr:hypothetical protein [Actinoplanes regularis]GIE89569.1 hypothetical protein Are01nite_60490 [Actinoplanes regularis]SNS55436.1 hypothetical protein SAMN06264365_11849 [Actinoplanes regularis]
MSYDTSVGIIQRHNEFAEWWCASLGLPPPKPWTEEDESRFQAWIDDGNRRAAEFFAGRGSEAA